MSDSDNMPPLAVPISVHLALYDPSQPHADGSFWICERDRKGLLRFDPTTRQVALIAEGCGGQPFLVRTTCASGSPSAVTLPIRTAAAARIRPARC
ncbi:MAG: hypothetical protein HC794_08020, partial [Nitrospiraceae bacterium]|nr:hypothetical protein [Nitrospiraceae bacterium]